MVLIGGLLGGYSRLTGEKPLTADFVVDVAPENMANDPMPTPLAKPVLKTDATAKKVTWNAVEGAERV